MIIGIGSDLIDIRRVEKSIERFGERFTARCFTAHEQERAEGRKDKAASYAKRFAAKEAMAKALGTGIARGVFWNEMGVVNEPSGRPTMAVTGRAAELLATLLPQDHVPVVHLTITDEFPYAQAFVIIEARPATPV